MLVSRTSTCFLLPLLLLFRLLLLLSVVFLCCFIVLQQLLGANYALLRLSSLLSLAVLWQQHQQHRPLLLLQADEQLTSSAPALLSSTNKTTTAISETMNPGWFLFSLLTRAFNGDEKPAVTYCTNTTEIMDALVLKNPHYSKFKIPQSGQYVWIQIWIQDVNSVSELTSDFELDLYLNEVWEDPQLAFKDLNPCKKDNITIPRMFYEQLWNCKPYLDLRTPNTVFINSKYASIHKSPFENIFLMIYPNGTVWANYRMKLTGPCIMDLVDFPMDELTCSLTFESFNYNTEEIKMRWMEEQIIILKDIVLPDFIMANSSTDRQEVFYPGGWWDEMTVTFNFKRRTGFYLLQGYIPTYLTIFISWISFYLGSKTMPARTMLGVNALLAMTFQFGNLMRNLPKVSYVKAIDVWMLAGMTFIFASLVELAIIGYLSRDGEGPRIPPSAAHREIWHRPGPGPEDPSPPLNHIPMKTLDYSGIRYTSAEHIYRRGCTRRWCCSCRGPTCRAWTPDKIDRLSMILFPTAFVLFNIFYWGWYLS